MVESVRRSGDGSLAGTVAGVAAAAFPLIGDRIVQEALGSGARIVGRVPVRDIPDLTYPANRGLSQLPWRLTFRPRVVEVVEEGVGNLVRVHGQGRQAGRWLTTADQLGDSGVAGLTDALNLPTAPTHVSRYVPRAGEKLVVGRAGPFGHLPDGVAGVLENRGGGLQIEALAYEGADAAGYGARLVGERPLTSAAVDDAVAGANALAPTRWARTAATIGKVATVAAVAWSVYDIGRTWAREGEFGERTRGVVGSHVGGFAGGWAGAKLGAVLGTALLPGAGTAVGGVVGGAIGGLLGARTGAALVAFT